jgi:hypothetical protein
MSTISVQIRYRPVRIGWCIRAGDMEQLRRAMRLTHTLWGGRFNPIIPIDDPGRADSLVEHGRLDLLWGPRDDVPVQRFVEKYTWLRWPWGESELFAPSFRGVDALYLDIVHPVRRINEDYIKNKPQPEVQGAIVNTQPGDPISDLLLATFGGYPNKDEIRRDYEAVIENGLQARRFELAANQDVPLELLRLMSPSTVSTFLLKSDEHSRWNYPGFYVGAAADFFDLVDFWNLRAAGLDLLFYDPDHERRLSALKDAFGESVRKRIAMNSLVFGDRVGVWSRPGRNVDLAPLGRDIIRCDVSARTWNGQNVVFGLSYIGRQRSSLAVVSEDEQATLSFQLPEKPFFDEENLRRQNVVISVRTWGDPSADARRTFWTPYFPRLNPYYTRTISQPHSEMRAEPDSLAIMESVTRNEITIRSHSRDELVKNIFGLFGMDAEVSEAGRIASRLIEQMGGIQGCRVFKITGVRKLIEQFGPLASFTRSAAVQIIGQNDPVTGRPHFAEFENLYIEQRAPGRSLKPEDAFLYLLKKGVFRVGLSLKCPNCALEFWIPLDDIATETTCEYCGMRFNITPQLRDRDWAYRRTGLFGKDDHQQGSIPVALTLQQLDNTLNGRSLVLTNMNLTPRTAVIEPCETDFVVLHQELLGGKPSLVIGESKTNDAISEEDVRKLSRLADAFPESQADVFILFSKVSPFIPEEINRCRAAQSAARRRVILFSERELEPYHVYERTAKEFTIDRAAVSLDDLALVTHDVYFEPKPRHR